MSDELKKRDADEKELQDIMDRFRDGDGPPPDDDAPVPVDPLAEIAALKDLITELTASNDGDADTLVSVISLEEFENETTDATPITDEEASS